ncbi:hypothetical protein D3C79_641600 [compost metagenome]
MRADWYQLVSTGAQKSCVVCTGLIAGKPAPTGFSTGLKACRNLWRSLWEITQPFRAALSRSKHEMYGFRSAAALTF